MSKQTVKHFLFMEHRWVGGSFEMKWQPTIRHLHMDDEADRIFIREIDLEVDIPDDFDPTPHQVKALEAQKREALLKYQQTVAEINETLSKLQAITYSPEVVA
jgi:hypothetical protein